MPATAMATEAAHPTIRATATAMGLRTIREVAMATAMAHPMIRGMGMATGLRTIRAILACRRAIPARPVMVIRATGTTAMMATRAM
jgi:hypothetical protein